MRKRPVCCACVFLMLCLCILDLAGIPVIRGNPLPREVREYIESHPSAVICGEVQRCQDTEYSLSVYLKQVFLLCQSEQIPIRNIRVFLEKNAKENLKTGMVIQVGGELERVSAPRNPGEFDSQQYYACQGIYYFLKNGIIQKKGRNYSKYGQFLTELRGRIGEILQETAGEDAGIYQAMLLGEKSGLDEEVRLRYQMAGMVHILAISGLHISVLGMGMFSLLKKLSFGNGWAGFLSLSVILQYGMLTGSSVSAMRAVCMFVLAVGARILGRSYDFLTALAVSAILLLLDTPAYLYSSSFLLSFGAVTGLGIVAPALNRLVGSERAWVKTLLSSFAVQLTTLPVLLRMYGEVSVLGIVLNLAVLPTVSVVLICGLCCVAVGFMSISAAGICLIPGKILLMLYEKLCVLAGAVPFCTWIGGKPEVWQIVGYYLVLATAVWMYRAGVKKSENGKIFAWKIRAVYAGMVCFAILLISYRPYEDFRIACLDVGQGDGIVVEIENRWNILIDGGSTNKNELGKYQLLPYLKSRGISRLDGIYVSHTDEDHISGVRELLEFVEKDLTSLRIENLILPKWSDIQENKNYRELTELAESAGVRVLTMKAGDEIRYGTVRLKVLWPESTASGKEVNEDAMVLEMISKDFKGLFTGDIGMVTEEKLIQNGCLEDVDFLKTAHHGSRYSTGAEFLEIVRPELAVVSCSATNTYGHPSPDTLERLKKSGSRVLITRDCGAVTIVNGKSVSAFNRIK